MRMRLRRREAPQLSLLAGVAVGATLLSVAAGAGGARHDAVRVAASAWRGLVGAPREQVAVGQRVIVVLKSPSLADRVATAGGRATEAQERRWTAAALAADNLLIARLAQQGVSVRAEYRYARVLTGFSAPLDPRALALVERAPEVAGVYPVRIAYPASLSSTLIERGGIAAGAGNRPNVVLPGQDGRGLTIALLDTGVDAAHPYLLGRVGEGRDVVDGDDDAGAAASPDDSTRLERHGTQLAGLLVGSGGPAGLNGIARGATVLPIRVAGWQREASGRWAVFGRSDQLVAGLERAVDPNGDGIALDGAKVALVGVAEPFAAFEDSPSARAVAGALRLDTLVVAPAGNDSVAGPGYGSIAGPGGSRAALTVGATDVRESTASVRVVLRTGLAVPFDRRVPLAGAVAPERDLTARLAAPRLGRNADAQGSPRAPALIEFFDDRGFSLVAGRAALVPAGADPGYAAEQAVRAGAVAVVLYGDTLPGGGIGLDDGVTVPVVSIPGWAGRAALAALGARRRPVVSIETAKAEANRYGGRVAPFSSRGLAFDGFVKPDLVAPGVALLTADAGRAEDGSARYSSISGSSAAAAVVAGAAALLAQTRPELNAPALKGVLAGTARPISGDSVAAQGTGLLDVGSALAAQVAVLPTTLGFGRATGQGWRATRKLVLLNLSDRRLHVDITADEHVITLSSSRVLIPPGGIGHLWLTARAFELGRTAIGGELVLKTDGGGQVRVPWLVAFTPLRHGLLEAVELSTHAFEPSDSAPAVLSFQAGRILEGGQVEPVARLDLELRRANGERLGALARLRDLLPGLYSFGLTGRDAEGDTLEAGRYRLRLTAYPTEKGPPSRASINFTIR
ncbi:MAG TPA: S8 family serine peptidase [Gaiellaceae bacterium]|nr:S8 family serine peptidase [Gaiellaceae bacterium]